MPASRWLRPGAARSLSQVWPLLIALGLLTLVRLSKGAFLLDAYAQLSRPFWPGTAQAEWLRSARRSEDQVRLAQLETENQRISRVPGGWWQQLLLGKGSLEGVQVGQAVLAPGGLIGLVSSVTPTTATVTLLTDPSSRVGVWVARNRRHALLSGLGTSRPVVRFLEKDPQVQPGDVVFTSPASTLVPPNLPVGVLQSVDERADPAPEAVVQLIAPIDAVDWVQVLVPR